MTQQTHKHLRTQNPYTSLYLAEFVPVKKGKARNREEVFIMRQHDTDRLLVQMASDAPARNASVIAGGLLVKKEEVQLKGGECMVVYSNPQGQVFARELSEFNRSFSPPYAAPQPLAGDSTQSTTFGPLPPEEQDKADQTSGAAGYE
jgi:hypothetical protein